MEKIKEIFDKVSNPSKTATLPTTEDLVELKEYMKEYQFSYVYSNEALGNNLWNVEVRKSMTRCVKSLARTNLLDQDIEEGEGNNENFVNVADQEIINHARQELKKNKSTSKPAILLQHLGKFLKFIGRISCGSKSGTCWVVSRQLVITCYHVYSSFMEERNSNSDLPIEVLFNYFHAERRENLEKITIDEERDPKIGSSALDYKFLRLRENSYFENHDGLGEQVKNWTSEKQLVVIVGHPGGNEMLEETCVAIKNSSCDEQLKQRQNNIGLHMTNDDRLRANQYQEKGCLSYDTTLFSGSSGSPVFDLNGNIVAMHLQGYTLKIDERRKVSLMEFGVQFSAICEDLKRQNFNPKDYFPHYNLGHDEEQMDEDNI